MMHTASDAQTGTSAPVKAIETNGNNEDAVLDDLLQRAMAFDQETVDGILGKAEIIFDIRERVNRKEVTRKKYDTFCNGLDIRKASTRRKWVILGRYAWKLKRPDLIPFLPTCWTTLLALVLLTERDFEEVIESGKLSRNMTAQTLNQIVPKMRRKTRASKPRAVVDIIGEMDDARTGDLLSELQRLVEKFPIKLILSPGLNIPGA